MLLDDNFWLIISRIMNFYNSFALLKMIKVSVIVFLILNLFPSFRSLPFTRNSTKQAFLASYQHQKIQHLLINYQ